jgi:hypothetical protein
VKANIKKAIRIIDALMKSHENRAQGMRNLCKNWSDDSKLKGLGLEIAIVDDNVIECIKLIKECLVEKPKRRKVEKPTST